MWHTMYDLSILCATDQPSDDGREEKTSTRMKKTKTKTMRHTTNRATSQVRGRRRAG